MNPRELHETALVIVNRYLKAEADLIDILQKIDESRAYLGLGTSSLYEYAVHKLMLSEAVAYNFITVSRKAREVPALKAEIEKGALSVSKARKITPVLTPENQDYWLHAAKTLSREKLEKEVARHSPKTATPERICYVTESRLQMTVGMSETLREKLRRAQDLISQSNGKAADLETTLETVLDYYLARKDPTRPGPAMKRAVKPETENMSQPVPGQAGTVRQNGSKPISPRLKRIVIKRDGGQCTELNDRGERCTTRRWLDVHHILFRSEGGEDVPENLVTLCRVHHRALHEARGPRKAYPGPRRAAS